MPTIQIPDEILLKIINSISSGPRRNDTRERNILSIQLANKQSFRVATEVLYRSVHIGSQKVLHSFLHTVLYYPSYAMLTKDLKLDYTPREQLACMQAVDHHSHTYDPKMLEAIQLFNLEDDGNYMRGFGTMVPTQHQRFNVTKVLILLCTLTRMKTLSVTPRADLSYLMARLHNLIGHSFLKLRTIKIDLTRQT